MLRGSTEPSEPTSGGPDDGIDPVTAAPMPEPCPGCGELTDDPDGGTCTACRNDSDGGVVVTLDAALFPSTPIASIDDAIFERGYVDACMDVLADYRTRLEAFAAARLPRGGKWPMEGIAPTVSLSDPKPQPTIVDRDAFARWYADLWPDEVRYTHELAVDDPQAVIDALAAGNGQSDDVTSDPEWRAARFDEVAHAMRVVATIVLPEKAVDRATKHTRLDDEHGWVTVDGHQAGPGVIVDGLAVKPAGEPRLTVRYDKAWLASLTRTMIAAVDRRLPPPDQESQQ